MIYKVSTSVVQVVDNKSQSSTNDIISKQTAYIELKNQYLQS